MTTKRYSEINKTLRLQGGGGHCHRPICFPIHTVESILLQIVYRSTSSCPCP